MFSLEDETLEKGGESILASKGDLGELLFSASAGLAHLSQGPIDLRSEADGFYTLRARSGALVDLKTRLVELKAEREKFDPPASDHGRLVETRDRSKAHYDEADSERTRTRDALTRSSAISRQCHGLWHCEASARASLRLRMYPRPHLAGRVRCPVEEGGDRARRPDGRHQRRSRPAC